MYILRNIAYMIIVIFAVLMFRFVNAFKTVLDYLVFKYYILLFLYWKVGEKLLAKTLSAAN